MKIGDLFEISEIDKGFMVNEPGLQVINSVTRLSKDRTVPLLIVNSTNKFQKIYRHGLIAKLTGVGDSNVKSVNSVLNEKSVLQPLDMKDLDVPTEYRSDIEQMIKNNTDLFATSDAELGCTDTVKMKIDTGDTKPIKLRPYRTPIKNRKIVDKAIDEMLDAFV